MVFATAILFVHAATAGVLIAALIVWEGPLAVKVLLVAFWLPLALLLKLLLEQQQQLHHLYIVLRLLFVSTEMRRIEPESARVATDILSADLKNEEEQSDIERALSGGAFPSMAVSLVYFLVVVVVAVALVLFWPG